MFRAGTVVRATGGIAVVRSENRDHPSIGTPTVDERLDDTGTVVDVFGPVRRPYLAISPPETRRPASLVGEVLYVRE
jgi:RNA-binding protein